MRQLAANNLKLVSNSDESDVTVINTCGFIRSAKQESLDTIFQAVQLKKEGRIKKLVVMGCLSERYEEDLRKEIPEIDACVGANKIERVVSALGADFKNELTGERMLTTPHHYAYLKISEGCDRPCSFCSIPVIRGKHVSKPLEKILDEANYLASAGVKELILIAQDTTYYGVDLYGKRMLASLLEKLSLINGFEWIRLMYAFPTGFPADVLKLFNECPKLCRYLDIPVQHVSDAVLLSMRRGINSRELRNLIENIRKDIPNIALRTTLIVGYPNEGEKEFKELYEFVEETKFERLGVFTYSPEEDTSAYTLGDPVTTEIKEERYNRIMEIQQEISSVYNQHLVGKRMKILVDHYKDKIAVGRTEFDAPEIDNEVHIESTIKLTAGKFCQVEIVDADAYDLFGKLTISDDILP